MLPSWTCSSRLERCGGAWRSAPAASASWPDHDEERARCRCAPALPSSAARPARCGSCRPGSSRDCAGQPRGHDRRQRRPPAPARAPAAPGRAAACPAGSWPPPSSSDRDHVHVEAVRLADQPQRDRAPEELPPPGWCERPTMMWPTPCERAKSRIAATGSRRAQAHHLRAQLAGQLDVGEQVALRLRVDVLGRFLRASRRRRRTSRC